MMTTTEAPEFYYCGRCGFLAEGGPQKLFCHCREPQLAQLHLEPFDAANIARVREAIARGGRVKV